MTISVENMTSRQLYKLAKEVERKEKGKAKNQLQVKLSKIPPRTITSLLSELYDSHQLSEKYESFTLSVNVNIKCYVYDCTEFDWDGGKVYKQVQKAVHSSPQCQKIKKAEADFNKLFQSCVKKYKIRACDLQNYLNDKLEDKQCQKET